MKSVKFLFATKAITNAFNCGLPKNTCIQSGADVYCDTQNIVRALNEVTDNHNCPTALRGKFWPSLIGQMAPFLTWPRVVLTSRHSTCRFIQDRGGLYFGPNWTPVGRNLNYRELFNLPRFDSIDSGLVVRVFHLE